MKGTGRKALTLGHAPPDDCAIGKAVECNFQNAGKWYPGRISALSGGSIGIAYDDGDRERTTTGRCRSR